jgi:hypothetical protein
MWKSIISIVVVVLFAVSMFYTYKKDYKKNLQYNFNGEVQNIRYDSKGFPYVTIDNRTYYLSYNNWDFNHRIAKGDTLQKNKNTFTVKLIKYKSSDVLIFK